MKKRLIEFLAYLEMGQKKFEQKVGLSNGFVNNVGDSIREANLAKISDHYPELNITWLKTGEGEMLNSSQKMDKIGKNNSGSINMSGRDVNIHHNGGKDEMIQDQKERLSDVVNLLYEELKEFHAEIKQKDADMKLVITESHARNERNMERVDKLIEQQNVIIGQQNLTMQKIQAQSDRLLDILEKKI